MIKVGVDIGNSKISCIVCDLKIPDTPKVLSFVSIPTLNVRKNILSNFKLIKDEVKDLLAKAAQESQTDIKSINLNIPTIVSTSLFYDSEIKIHNEAINELHLKKIINNSTYFDEYENKKTLLNYIINYDLDKKPILGSPIGTYSNNLKANFYRLMIDDNIFKTYKNLFKELKIHIENFIPTPLSSSIAVLNSDDKDLGAICIDLGDSTTSVSVFENNKLIFCDSISVGSKNITNDIARGISTTKESAERLKTLYGSVLSSPSDDYEIIEVPLVSSDEANFKQINRSTINLIIKPRVEETLELVWQKLKQFGLHKKKINNLILTGGGSELEGINEYAEIIFSSNVRIGSPLNVFGLNKKFSGPKFSQTIGSILFKAEDYEIQFLKNKKKIQKNAIFSHFSSWLDKYI